MVAVFSNNLFKLYHYEKECEGLFKLLNRFIYVANYGSGVNPKFRVIVKDEEKKEYSFNNCESIIKLIANSEYIPVIISRASRVDIGRYLLRSDHVYGTKFQKNADKKTALCRDGLEEVNPIKDDVDDIINSIKKKK